MVDIFKSGTQAIVVPVNTVGAMGKGLALAAKRKYGDALYNPYRAACALSYIEVGDEGVAQAMTVKVEGKSIILAPTKEHWRDPSHLIWVRGAMQAIIREVIENNITSVAIPALGCGEGGLDWNEVEPLINAGAKQLSEIGVVVEVTPPNGIAAKSVTTEIPLCGEFVLVPIRGRAPNNVLYCGRGKGGVVAEKPGQYGWLGNPVKFGVNAPTCPLCGGLHNTAAETLPCYREYLRHRLNTDKAFRQAFIEAMTSHTRLACFCTSTACHTSVMAEVFSEWRQRRDATRLPLSLQKRPNPTTGAGLFVCPKNR
jgi:O-acetyl-ADP-ribose deacetylase (regulator of RNase III)